MYFFNFFTVVHFNIDINGYYSYIMLCLYLYFFEFSIIIILATYLHCF